MVTAAALLLDALTHCIETGYKYIPQNLIASLDTKQQHEKELFVCCCSSLSSTNLGGDYIHITDLLVDSGRALGY